MVSYPLSVFSTIAGAQAVGGVALNFLVNAINDLNSRLANSSLVLSADVATSEGTTSGSYTDLATAGPSISGVNLAVGQTCLVIVSAIANSGSTATTAKMGFAVSVADTVAAVDADAGITKNVDPHTILRICPYAAATSGTRLPSRSAMALSWAMRRPSIRPSSASRSRIHVRGNRSVISGRASSTAE